MKTVANFLEKKFQFDAHYFLKGSIWLSAHQVFTAMLSVVTTSVLAYFLNESDYGIYRYLIAMTALLTAFSLTGLGQAVLQATAKGFGSFYYHSLRINLLYSLGVTITALGGSLYYFLNDNTTLSIGCFLIAIIQPVIISFQNLPSYMQGKKKFKAASLLLAIRAFATATSLLVTLYFTNNIIHLFLVFLLSTAATNILTNYFTNVEKPPLPEIIRNRYTSYAKHTSIRNMLSVISGRLDTIIVFTQLGATEVALYTIATVLPEQVKSFVKNIANLLLPKYASQSTLTTKKSIPRRSMQLFFLLIAAVSLYVFLAPSLYGLLFPKYEAAVFLSQIAALSLPALVAIIPMSMLQSQLSEKALYLFSVYSSITLIVATIVLVFLLGILGAVLAKIVARYANMTLAYYLVSKY